VIRSTDTALREGHYAAKQIFCKDRVIAWSHRRRFATGLDLAKPFRGRRLLDYGCGDGTFLALLASSAARPAETVGAELDEYWVNDCRTRLGDGRGLSFVSIDSLDAPLHRGRYDAVVCMEVLEHVINLDPVIDRLWRLLAPGGTLLVSVPVETGLPLLVKQAVRRAAGWRGIGGYAGDVRRERHNRHPWCTGRSLGAANAATSLEAVELRHAAIHEDDVVMSRPCGFHGLKPILDDVCAHSETGKRLDDDLAVDRTVVRHEGQQIPEARRGDLRTDRARVRRRVPVGEALQHGDELGVLQRPLDRGRGQPVGNETFLGLVTRGAERNDTEILQGEAAA